MVVVEVVVEVVVAVTLQLFFDLPASPNSPHVSLSHRRARSPGLVPSPLLTFCTHIALFVMSTPGFISSFLPVRPPRPATASLCPAAPPAMTLVSHEKTHVVSTSSDAELAKYRLSLEIPGTLSKLKRGEIVRALKKNGQYDGFRRGTIPPFVMRTVPRFVLQDCVEETLAGALEELELKPVQGDENEPDIDLDSMIKTFIVGETFAFDVHMPLNKITGTLDDEPDKDIVQVEDSINTGDFDMHVQELKGNVDTPPTLPDVESVAEMYIAAKEEENKNS